MVLEMDTIPDVMDTFRFQKLENVSRVTAVSYLNKLEESGVVRSVPMSLARSGRPRKLYMVRRERYHPEAPMAGDFVEFLNPLVKLESDLDLQYALGLPFSSSVHGRVAYYPPLQVFVEDEAKNLVRELYAQHREVAEVKVMGKRSWEKSWRDSGLSLLSPEDTVVECLKRVKKTDRPYPVEVVEAVSVLLRKCRFEGDGVNVQYLSKRAVEEDVSEYLLGLNDLLEREYGLALLSDKWKLSLSTFSLTQGEDLSERFDPDRLERFVSLPKEYFETKAWADFFGVEELGVD